MDYIYDNVSQGLADLLRSGLAAGDFSREEIEAASRAEAQAVAKASGALVLSGESQELLHKVAASSDRDLLQVAAKILKSARLAALTHRDPQPADYVDQPLFPSKPGTPGARPSGSPGKHSPKGLYPS